MKDSKTYSINNSTVKVIYGDLLSSNAEVITISGSVGLPMIGGLPQAVREKAGESVAYDASKHPDAKLGDVVMTGAGNLKTKYLFHAVTVSEYSEVLPHFSTDNLPEVCEYIISHAINKCLRLLTVMDLSSIAFPCLGLGMANMPLAGVAKITAKTITNFLVRTNKSISVELYIKDTYDVYSRFDYLPFFEWFAAYTYKAEKSIEKEEHTDAVNAMTFNDVVIPDFDSIENGQHKVFISYSRKDSESAKGICDTLNKMNIPYWIDIDGVYSGANFKEVIVNAISTSEIVIFLSSTHSNKSNNVAKEISIADKYGKVIIPVRLDPSPLNPKMDYDLAGVDFVELFSFDERNISKLRNAILGHLAMNHSK